MVFDLLDSDGLPGKDQAEIDLLSLVADASACCDGDGLVVEDPMGWMTASVFAE